MCVSQKTIMILLNPLFLLFDLNSSTSIFVQRVLDLYQDANIGPLVDTKSTYATFMANNRRVKPGFSSPKGWKVDHGKENVSRRDVMILVVYYT